jgi:ABC-type spermidine/putrescine transport system permease subunit II
VTLPLIKPGHRRGALFAAIISWTDVELSTASSLTHDDPAQAVLLHLIFGPTNAAVSAATIYVAVVAVVDVTSP